MAIILSKSAKATGVTYQEGLGTITTWLTYADNAGQQLLLEQKEHHRKALKKVKMDTLIEGANDIRKAEEAGLDMSDPYIIEYLRDPRS